jgi:toxin-antitoxin system PIN domain toxin
VIAVDTNILVYARREDSPSHEAAKRCLEELAAGRAPWALPWPVVHEFVAVVTRLAHRPTPLEGAFEFVEMLLGSRSCVPLAEPPGYQRLFKDLATTGKVAGVLVFDARIAAICLAHGVRELWTADHDFGRFPSLNARNPLVG